MTSNPTILVATDLSAPARHAVDRAFQLAADTGHELQILHALELDFLDAMRELLGKNLSAAKSTLEADALNQLRQLASDPRHPGGVAVQARVVSGAPLEVVIREADGLDAALVVLGARGESFLRHALLGTTASRLLRKSILRPVLIVKQAPHEAYRRILIPVDFSAISLRTICFARQLAPTAEIFLLHAFEAPFEGKLTFAGVEESVIQRYRDSAREEAMRRMHELAGKAGLDSSEYTPLVVHGNSSDQILKQEQERNCDLIVVGKHGQHVTEAMLLGSVTKHVLTEAQGDVLVICD
jgi:nucleotide-binding universal stress UspA family protein